MVELSNGQDLVIDRASWYCFGFMGKVASVLIFLVLDPLYLICNTFLISSVFVGDSTFLYYRIVVKHMVNLIERYNHCL